MISILERHWYFLLGITAVVVYAVLLITFFRRYSENDGKPVPIWWHFLLGPVVLLKRRADQTGQKKLLTSREQYGWIAVVTISVIVVVWKLVSKL